MDAPLVITLKVELGPETLRAFDRVAWAIEALANLQRTEGTELMKTLADLQADVAANTGVTASAVTLISGIAAQLKNLSAAGTPVDPAEIDALATQLEQNSANLSAAVVANTPAAPATAAQPTPPATPATEETPPAAATDPAAQQAQQ